MRDSSRARAPARKPSLNRRDSQKKDILESQEPMYPFVQEPRLRLRARTREAYR